MDKIKELKDEENNLWEYFLNNNLKEETIDKIHRIIEINLELEKLTNQ